MTRRQIDRVVVVEAAARGQPFRGVVAHERRQVRHLLAFGVDNPKSLAAAEFERNAALG